MLSCLVFEQSYIVSKDVGTLKFNVSGREVRKALQYVGIYPDEQFYTGLVSDAELIDILHTSQFTL